MSLSKRPVRLMVVSVSAGSGHVKAAEALIEAAHEKDLIAEHIDLMDFVSAPTKTAFVDAYSLMIKRMPVLWSFLYKNAGQKNGQRAYGRLTKILSKFDSTKFYQKLLDFSPTHTIATHLLPASLIAELPGRAYTLGFVATDYELHPLYLEAPVDKLFVATPKSLFEAKTVGHATDTYLTGIPVSSQFSKKIPLENLKKELLIDEKSRIFLALSGGDGLARLDLLVESLAKTGESICLIAVTGKNLALKHRLENLRVSQNLQLITFGWRDDIANLMRLAELVITKPGGLTVSECLALRKPILAINPIPGQEEGNLEFILKNGYGVHIKNELDLLYYLKLPPRLLAPGFTQNPTQDQSASGLIIEKILEN